MPPPPLRRPPNFVAPRPVTGAAELNQVLAGKPTSRTKKGTGQKRQSAAAAAGTDTKPKRAKGKTAAATAKEQLPPSTSSQKIEERATPRLIVTPPDSNVFDGMSQR